jgi:hypothetical protein
MRGLDQQQFIQTLDIATQTWFGRNLESALDPLKSRQQKHKTRDRRSSNLLTEKDIVWNAAHAAWSHLPLSERTRLQQVVSVTTEEGRRRVFGADRRVYHEDKHVEAYLRDRIRIALNGGHVLNMGKMVRHSWSRSGFGIFAHIHPDIGLQVFMKMRRFLAGRLGTTVYPAGIPHLIYKPPGGSKLQSHIDTDNTDEILQLSIDNVARFPGGSNEAWFREQGVQVLAHLRGGQQREGSTCILGPMDPWRLAICILFVHPDHMFPAIAHDVTLQKPARAFAGVGTGPRFFPFEDGRVLPHLNRALAYIEGIPATMDWRTLEHSPSHPNSDILSWMHTLSSHAKDTLFGRNKPVRAPDTAYHSLGLQPIVPCEGAVVTGPYIAMWGTGYIHGSFENSRDSRVSITLPITTRPPSRYACSRITKRLNILQSLNPGTPDHLRTYDRGIAERWIKRKNILPYADGSTHYQPSKEFDLFVCGFDRLLPRTSRVNEFIETLVA